MMHAGRLLRASTHHHHCIRLHPQQTTITLRATMRSDACMTEQGAGQGHIAVAPCKPEQQQAVGAKGLQMTWQQVASAGNLERLERAPTAHELLAALQVRLQITCFSSHDPWCCSETPISRSGILAPAPTGFHNFRDQAYRYLLPHPWVSMVHAGSCRV